jgi:hypothetical protein
MGRAVLAVVVGCVVSVLIVFGMDAISHLVYPPPAELNVRDPAAMRAIIDQMPIGAFIIVVAGWILGAGFGSWFATRLSAGKAWAGGAVGGVTLAATGINLFTIAHPTWVVLAALIGIPLATWGGVRAARTPPSNMTTAPAAYRQQ